MTDLRVQREDTFDFSAPEYADLYSRSSASAFQHPVWLTALYEVLAPKLAVEKVVVTARGADGALLLVLPLVRRRRGILRVLEFADLGVNDYAAPVADPESVATLAASPVPAQIRAVLGAFDLLRIERVADDPDLLVSLIAGATATRHAYDAHLIDLGDSADAWHSGLDPKFARHIERKYKRLRPKGERRLRSVTDPAEVASMMKLMQGFRAARFADRRGVDLVQDPDCFDFYQEVAQRSVAAGPARLDVLEVGGEPVAVALDLVEADRELFVLVGYDVERLRNYSLGLLIVDQLVQDAIGRGKAHFDLTVGDEGYKSDFGARARPLYEVRVQGTVRGRVGVFIRSEYLRGRRLAKKFLLVWEQRREKRK